MPRIVALVDGFNLYHSLAENPAYHPFKWLNIDKLLKTYFPRGIEKVFYFTSPTPWDADKVARHKILIRALESTGVECGLRKIQGQRSHLSKVQANIQIKRRKANRREHCTHTLSDGIRKEI